MNNLNFKSTYFVDSPFVIFEIENFLGNDFYEKILKSFPDEFSLSMSHRNGGKKYLNDRSSKEVERIFKNSNALSEFRDCVVSNNFLKRLLTCFVDNGVLVPNSNLWRLCDSRKSASLIRKFSLKVQATFIRLSGFYPVRISLEFGMLKKGDCIPPHNDSENKIVSLVFYLADNNDPSNFKYGTIFYKKKNIEDKEIPTSSYLVGNELAIFEEKYAEFHRVQYRPNTLSGFIRTANSWHGVQDIDSQTLIRKSIVINILKV